jgi:superfamily II DNA/RNA helicase
LKKKKKNSENKNPSILVLAPTRELALQIEEHTKDVKSEKVTSICLYGGVSKSEQVKSLKKQTDIIIATPGRLIDILEDGSLSLDNISFMVFGNKN